MKKTSQKSESISKVEALLLEKFGSKENLIWEDAQIVWGGIVIGTYNFRADFEIFWNTLPREFFCSGIPLAEVEDAVLYAVSASYLNLRESFGTNDINQFIDLVVKTFRKYNWIESDADREKIGRGEYRLCFSANSILVCVLVHRKGSGVFHLEKEVLSLESPIGFDVLNLASLEEAVLKIVS